MGESSLADLSIAEFLERLASDAPTPGGGAVAALTGANPRPAPQVPARRIVGQSPDGRLRLQGARRACAPRCSRRIVSPYPSSRLAMSAR